jgi:hypothetical protein
MLHEFQSHKDAHSGPSPWEGVTSNHEEANKAGTRRAAMLPTESISPWERAVAVRG